MPDENPNILDQARVVQALKDLLTAGELSNKPFKISIETDDNYYGILVTGKSREAMLNTLRNDLKSAKAELKAMLN